MKKSDLKTGMVVEFDDSTDKYLVLKDFNSMYTGGGRDIFLNLHGSLSWRGLEYYGEDLIGDCGYTVTKVYSSKHPYTIFSKINDDFKSWDYLDLLWEREEVREMTIEEIQYKLGHKVKIVE